MEKCNEVNPKTGTQCNLSKSHFGCCRDKIYNANEKWVTPNCAEHNFHENTKNMGRSWFWQCIHCGKIKEN